MRSKCRESESCYSSGCRSDLCKQAASVARRERRRLAREAVGELSGLDTDRTDRTPVVSVPVNNASTSVNADISVVTAVLEEVQVLDATARPGLVAAAIAMARILDNPKAISSQPPAAGQLINIINQLRKGAQGGRPKLASVRQMTTRSKLS